MQVVTKALILHEIYDEVIFHEPIFQLSVTPSSTIDRDAPCGTCQSLVGVKNARDTNEWTSLTNSAH